MNCRILLFLCTCIGSFPVTGFGEGDAVTVHVAASDYSELMQGLPWEFKRNSSSITAEEGDASSEVRWEFVSAKPVRMSAGGSLYLRADLTVSEFGKAGVAESRWQALLEKAHPDMGLSYAWDYLIFRGQVIYRLHADCTFSDSGFDSIIVNLKAMLPQEDIEKAQTIRCSCGGGCRGGPVIEAIKGGRDATMNRRQRRLPEAFS